MRPRMSTKMTFLLAASTLAACNWTKFDDLADETWVNSTGKPDVKSADWGVAITRGADSSEAGSTGTLAIIGAGPGTYSELKYNESGSSHFENTSLALAAQGIMTVDSPTIWLSSPVNSEVALVTTGNAGSIVVANGQHLLSVRQLFTTNTSLEASTTIGTTPDAATYFQPAGFPDLPGITPTPQPIVAVADVVMGTIINLPNNSKQPACKLTDGSTQMQIRALGTAPAGDGTDDLLVWNGKDGRLLKYDGSAYNGCIPADPRAPIFQPALTDKPGLLPGKGSQILRVDDDRVVLAGHTESGDGSLIQVFSSDTLAPIGNPITTPGLRQAAIFEVGGTFYVVAGYPTALVDTTTSGQVLIFKIGASGLETAQVATLHDAQPEGNQSFGRSVAVMPYRGKSVIAVAADNEVFVYFQAKLEDGSELYAETRQVK